MDKIYSTIFEAEHTHFKNILENIDATHNLSKSLFEDYTGSDREYLDTFAFMALLSYDIYLKKKLMEKLIDSWAENDSPEESKKEAKKKEPKKEGSSKKKEENS